MTRAHSCLIATISWLDGGTLAGPRALLGNIALRMACSADGRAVGSSRRVRIEWESNLRTTSARSPSRAEVDFRDRKLDYVHMQGLD